MKGIIIGLMILFVTGTVIAVAPLTAPSPTVSMNAPIKVAHLKYIRHVYLFHAKISSLKRLSYLQLLLMSADYFRIIQHVDHITLLICTITQPWNFADCFQTTKDVDHRGLALSSQHVTLAFHVSQVSSTSELERAGEALSSVKQM